MISTKYFFDYRNDNLFKESLENIQRYLDGLGYPKEVIENICFQKFIQNNPDYYLYYPYLFDSAFDFSDKKVLEMLSIAGFLYYRSIILMDDISFPASKIRLALRRRILSFVICFDWSFLLSYLYVESLFCNGENSHKS